MADRHALALVAFGVVLTPLALLAFNEAIIHAKKTGPVASTEALYH